ncbi:hypothetical protein [Desulfofarcimen acetoxidans]|nr:hypothetical protein [Desulfofarcimen acetoxidans]
MTQIEQWIREEGREEGLREGLEKTAIAALEATEKDLFFVKRYHN